ncbi:MAG: FtsX-like permease family protein [Ilumatobacteraceae bacterium]|nr:FtsX-like permease family protein [Ilumatobacteraceae bacterium]
MSIRNLFAKKLRLVATALAIVLGVAFTTGTMVLTDTMLESLDGAIAEVNEGVDVFVRGLPVGEDEVSTLRGPVDLDHVERIRSIDGVSAAEPYWVGYTQVVGTDGKALSMIQSVGLNWIDDAELSAFELTDGRPPGADDEIVLGTEAADEAGVDVGDPVDVITLAGRERFTVSGLASVDGVPGAANSAFTFFTADAAEQRLGDVGTAAQILTRSDSMTADELAGRIGLVVRDADVVTGDALTTERQDDLAFALGVFETILLVFGAIALFVGSFTIANTFTITVAQRTKELALVRAIGASRRQVLGSVVIEAALTGLLAAAGGLVAGLGVARGLMSAFASFGLDFPDTPLVIQTSTVVAAFAVGVGVTIAAALVPARRAATVAPIDAMRDASIESTGISRKRLAVGGVLAALGAYALVRGVVATDAPLVGLGSVATFHAVLALGPMLVRPITRLVAFPLRRLGTAGRLAAANADRNPRRSASTAAALTIGVTLVAGASMFASTASASVRGDAAEVLVADAVVRPIGANPGLPSDVVRQAAAVDGAEALPLHQLSAEVDGSMEFVGGIDLAIADDFVDVMVLDGSIGTAIDTVVVGDDLADERGWAPGDQIMVVFPDGARPTLRITGIIEQTNALPAIVGTYQAIAPHGIGLDRAVLLAGDAAAIDAVDAALAGQPTAVVESIDDYAESLVGALNTMLNLVLGLLGLAVVIAVLGIATTIGLSVHERTRELGVLRAIGMERRQVRRSIRLEAVVIAMFGTVLGLAMGLGFTAAAISTLADDGFGAPTIPVPTLIAIVIGAVAAGTIAAALPARTAARRPVLDAIATN